MKLDFKRIMSSVLAFVMLFSSLIMVNVVSVSAAVETPDVAWNFSDLATVSSATEKDTPVTATSPSGKVSDSSALAGTALTGIKVSKNEKDYSSVKDSYYQKLTNRLQLQGKPQAWYPNNDKIPTQRAFKFTTTGPATLRVYLYTTKDRPITVYGGDMKDVSTVNTTGAVQMAEFSLTAAGTYYIYSGKDGMDLWAVTLNYKSGDVYTITGSCSGIAPKEEFTLTDNSKQPPATYNAVVNDTGDSYTATVNAEAAPFAAGTQLDVTAQGYTVTPSQVTLTATEDTKKFTADTLEFASDQETVTLKAVDESGIGVAATAYAESNPSEAISIPAEGVQIKIDKGATETYHVGKPDEYLGTSVNVESSQGEATVNLKKIPAPTDGYSLNSSLFYSVDPEINASATDKYTIAEAIYNLNLKNFTANGYTLSQAKVQMIDSGGNLQKRINLSANATIEYTPSADGVLKINGASGSSNAENRGYTITPAPASGPSIVTYKKDTDAGIDSSTTRVDKEHTLKSGQKYVIKVDNGAINFYDLTFTAGTAEETYTVAMGENTEGYPEVSLNKYTATGVNDKVIATWSANDTYLEGSQEITLINDWLDGTTFTIPYSAISFKKKSTEAPGVWTGAAPNDLLGSAFNVSGSEATGNRTATFEDKIFNDGQTGCIANQIFVSTSGKSIVVSADGTLKIYMVSHGNNATVDILEDGTTIKTETVYGRGTAAETLIPAITFDVKAGSAYTFEVDHSDFNGSLFRAEFTPGAAYPVTINATNNTSKDVTVHIGGKTFTATASQKTTTEGLELYAGKNTFTATGYVFDPAFITVNADETGEQNVFDVTIDESQNVRVQFNLADSDANGQITISNLTSKASFILDKSGDSFTDEDVAPGTQYKIVGDSADRNVYMWLTRRNGEVDKEQNTGSLDYSWKDDIKFFDGGKGNRFFIYTVPDAETVSKAGKTGSYGVEFYASNDIGTLDINSPYMKGDKMTNDNAELNFGQYGFGADKIRLCKNDARQFVDYDFELAGMSDYINNSYSANIFNGLLTEFNGEKASIQTYNEFGILNADSFGNETYVKFKVSDEVVPENDEKIKAIVDRSGEPIVVKDITNGGAGTDVSTSDILNSSGSSVAKQSFEVIAGHTYQIKTKSTDKNKVTYIKSIRILNPNNIFDNNAATTNANKPVDLGEVSTLSSTNPDLYSKLVEENTSLGGVSGHIFRIIGTINLTGDDAASAEAASSALANIQAVGFDAYDEDTYNTWNQGDHTSGDNLFNDNSTVVASAGTKPTPTRITFADVANLAVEQTGDAPAVGSLPATDFSKVYVQTFFAADKNMVLVPWVSYKDSPSTRVYSVIARSATDENNNVVLTVTPAE